MTEATLSQSIASPASLHIEWDEDIAPQWEVLYPSLLPLAERLLQRIWQQEAQPHLERQRQWTVSLLLVDDAEMQRINQQQRDKDKPTNVLSFPQWEFPHDWEQTPWQYCVPPSEDIPLGDIILAQGVLQREALEQHKPMLYHCLHMLVHGMLHLLGYDHQDEAEAEQMEAKEIAYLEEERIANPYQPAMHEP